MVYPWLGTTMVAGYQFSVYARMARMGSAYNIARNRSVQVTLYFTLEGLQSPTSKLKRLTKLSIQKDSKSERASEHRGEPPIRYAPNDHRQSDRPLIRPLDIIAHPRTTHSHPYTNTVESAFGQLQTLQKPSTYIVFAIIM